jgi:hypothetical protein
MQERLDQKITVRGVPKILYLSLSTKIGKRAQNVDWNRDRNLAYCIGLFTVLDIWLDELGSCHGERSP